MREILWKFDELSEKRENLDAIWFGNRGKLKEIEAKPLMIGGKLKEIEENRRKFVGNRREINRNQAKFGKFYRKIEGNSTKTS
jgi:hypothetical protein